MNRTQTSKTAEVASCVKVLRQDAPNASLIGAYQSVSSEGNLAAALHGRTVYNIYIYIYIYVSHELADEPDKTPVESNMLKGEKTLGASSSWGRVDDGRPVDYPPRLPS